LSDSRIQACPLHNLIPLNFLAVGLGAAFGAWVRWLLGLALNPLLIALPLGTLAANLIGGYLVGWPSAFSSEHAFPAGLETVRHHGFPGRPDHLPPSRPKSSNACWPVSPLAIGLASVHLAGSLTATYLGLLSVGASRIWA
jgi:CrcB protein